jgi:hypothetical protein
MNRALAWLPGTLTAMHIRVDLVQKARAEAAQTFVKGLASAHRKVSVSRAELEPPGSLTFQLPVVFQSPQHT